MEIAYNVAVTKITTRYGIVYQNEEIEVENHVVVIPLLTSGKADCEYPFDGTA